MSNFKNNGTDKGHGPAVCDRKQWLALCFSDKCHYEEYELKEEGREKFPYYAKGKAKHLVIERHHKKLFPKAKVRSVTYL
jgi:hypothetical protein